MLLWIKGENGWKQSNNILPSSVAGFMVIYFLDVRDRHKGNMVVTGGDRFANIDFGWLAEGNKLGTFPIPAGLQYLLQCTNLWDEFHDLCWDALKVMYENFESIEKEWEQALSVLELNDRKFFDEMPRDIRGRLSITRSALDESLRKYDFDTAMGDFKHAIGNFWKGLTASTGPSAETKAKQRRLEERLSSASLLSGQDGTLDAVASGATGDALTRTRTESLHSWLAKVKLEAWHDSLVEHADCEHVINLVALFEIDPTGLDKVLEEIGMGAGKAATLKRHIQNTIKQDPRFAQ